MFRFLVLFGAPDIPAPVITSVNPAEGTKDGGTEVFIKGSFHHWGLLVLIGGKAPLSGTFDSRNLFIRTPPGEAGPVDIKIVHEDGKSVTLEKGFTYLDNSI